MTFSDCLMAYPNDTAAQSACWAVERCNYVQGFDLSCSIHRGLLIALVTLTMIIILGIWIYRRGEGQLRNY